MYRMTCWGVVLLGDRWWFGYHRRRDGRSCRVWFLVVLLHKIGHLHLHQGAWDAADAYLHARSQALGLEVVLRPELAGAFCDCVASVDGDKNRTDVSLRSSCRLSMSACF